MSLSDFIIIYLACGAPVGVWFYFNQKNSENVFAKSLLAAVFWIIFIFQFLQKRFSDNLLKTDKTSDIRWFQKSIEKMLPEQFSIFEFREVVERYIGLTLAEQDSQNNALRLNNDFSARFNSRNEELSAKCLNRTDRRKLKAHQNYARKDFLQTIREVSEQIDDSLVFLNVNLNFVITLNDETAEIEIEKLIEETTQIINENSVKQKEVELWNNEKRMLPTVEQTNFHFVNTKPQVIRMTTKD